MIGIKFQGRSFLNPDTAVIVGGAFFLRIMHFSCTYGRAVTDAHIGLVAGLGVPAVLHVCYAIRAAAKGHRDFIMKTGAVIAVKTGRGIRDHRLTSLSSWAREPE